MSLQQQRSRRAVYRNPVYDGYFADPFILALDGGHDGGYVAYGTGEPVDGRRFPVLRSDDLVAWTPVGAALEPVGEEHGTDYWAPEVVAAEGRFWMYYSVGFGDHRHHLRVAVAESPLGPFADCGLNLTPDELFAIDPHPFRDVDGRWYLYYARDVLTGERVGTHLAVAELDSMTNVAGASRSVLAPTADWQIFERGRSMYSQIFDWHTLEGPNVRRHGDRYHCLYSGGSYLNESYHVAWVSAPHPLGPWSAPGPDRGRLLATVPGRVRGPGHNSVVTAAGGGDVIVYHAWDAAGQRRQMCIDPLIWRSDGPYTPGPSWTEQVLSEEEHP